MISEAVVKALNEDGTVLVGCENTACNACHAQMFCNNKTQTQYPARNDNNLDLRVGDRVSLFLPPGKTILSTVLLFALPLMLFPLGYLASGLLPVYMNEVQKALCGLGAMALAFVVAAVVNTRNKRSLMPIVQSVVMRHLDVVGAAIMRDGRLFAAQCSSKKPEIPYQWEFPGGKIEQGETPEHAVVREIAEELGVHVSVERLITEVSYRYEHFYMTMKVFLCSLGCDFEPRLSEHLGAKWIGPEELYTLDWAPADSLALDNVAEACWPV
mgnify:FL=1